MSTPITTASQLRAMHCAPQKGADAKLSPQESARLAGLLGDWTLDENAAAIGRDFRFADFHQTMAFVNALAWIAHREDHHPDLEVGYGHCRVRLNTHDVSGLSINDFIVAARIDALEALTAPPRAA